MHFCHRLQCNVKQKMFCALTDFSQACDNVWREGLWFKIYKSGITGNCLTFFSKNIYNGICFKSNWMTKLYLFLTLVYVKEKTCNFLTFFLFSIYTNDIKTYALWNLNELISITSNLMKSCLFKWIFYFVFCWRHCHTNRVSSRLTTCAGRILYILLILKNDILQMTCS